ncbi:MAG TPA: FecR domain-containing protein [Verrucomicrobiota bacterium]|nr:hypothetical protein [Verrucomicrobiales bacterium]HRI13232.1 FecR domain-containing protein [Verrucomicrobiota bacterium]
MNYFGRFSRFLCAGAILALAVNLAVAAPQAGRATVVQVNGNVSIGSQPATVGQEVSQGAIIKTGPASDVLINLGANGGYTRVLEDSTVTVDELTVDSSGPETIANTQLGLKQGKLESQVNRLSSKSKYVVQTPTTTAAIRGTVFRVYANGAVLVWDGCVDVIVRDQVTNREARYAVCAGQMFDPNIPGVVPIPSSATSPNFVVGPSAAPPIPIGPQVFVSPVDGPPSEPIIVEPELGSKAK